MATVLVLFGIIGHFIGFAGIPAANVRPTLHPASRRKLWQSGRQARATARFSDRSNSREN